MLHVMKDKISLILMVFSIAKSNIIRTNKYIKLQGCQNNYLLDNSIIFSQNTSSKIACSKICDFTDNCLSFNIKGISHHRYLCELNSKFETLSCAHLSHAFGYQYYFKVTNFKICYGIVND